ncbi:MAG: hypothetical protein Kilf2KO_30980 [Rhodospirillales bacterium]
MLRILVLLVSLGALAACAQSARVSQMSTGAVEAGSIARNPGLQGALDLGEVTDQREISAFKGTFVEASDFRQALDQSLQASGLLAIEAQEAPYRLTANLLAVDLPMLGFDLTVDSTVDYVVAHRATGQPFFEKTITNAYTADFSDAVIGVKRAQLANEGAMKANISAFIKEFVSYWIANQPPVAEPDATAVSLLALD